MPSFFFFCDCSTRLWALIIFVCCLSSIYLLFSLFFFKCEIPEQRQALLVKIASVREVVLGAPLRFVLKNLATKTVAPEMDQLIALVHRPKESFFLLPQVLILSPEKLILVESLS